MAWQDDDDTSEDFGSIGGEFGGDWGDDISEGGFGSIGGDFGGDWADDVGSGFGDIGGEFGSFGDGLSGFGGISNDSDNHYTNAFNGFKIGNYSYAFNELVSGIFTSAVEYGTSIAGGNIGLAIGGAFGVPGAVTGYVIGKYVGGKLGTEIAEAMLDGEVNNYSDEELNDIFETIAKNNGTTPGEIIKAVTEGIDNDGIENLIQDLIENFRTSTYYEVGLSRRRSNIIGTGRRGLTIE